MRFKKLTIKQKKDFEAIKCASCGFLYHKTELFNKKCLTCASTIDMNLETDSLKVRMHKEHLSLIDTYYNAVIDDNKALRREVLLRLLQKEL